VYFTESRILKYRIDLEHVWPLTVRGISFTSQKVFTYEHSIRRVWCGVD